MSRPDVEFIEILQETNLNMQFGHFLHEKDQQEVTAAQSQALILEVCCVISILAV